MVKKLSELRNLGPETQKWLESIGINSAEELAARDPVDVYAELKLKGYPVSKNLLTAIVGAVQDVDWREIDPAIKHNLYERIDELETEIADIDTNQ